MKVCSLFVYSKLKINLIERCIEPKVFLIWLLSILQLNDSIKEEIIANQRMIPPGKSLIALNGALISIEDMDLYM